MKRTGVARRSTKRETTVPLLLFQCKAVGLPIPETELRFDVNGRKWRLDVAWPAWKFAVEIEGGVFMAGGSRHSRGAGFREDRVKYGTAFSQGWTILSVLPEQVKSGQAVQWIEARFQLTQAKSPSGVPR